MKIGRNDPCPCKSGVNYKKCCGNLAAEKPAAGRNPYPRPIPPEVFAAIRRHEANELIREQQQGLGRPIVSFQMNDHQMVAAGNTLYWSPKWKTFPDFLSDYLKIITGGEWGNAEIAKPLAERHPLMQWYDAYCHFQRQHGVSGEIKSAPMTGVVNCYLGLAYSLYLIKHNVELQERLLKRLKNPTQFQGAYYELMVANSLIRAGFELALEDETDGASKHCEFSAISKKTGKKYWVEAKMRGVVGLLGKTEHDGTKNPDATSELIKHLNGAFAKPAADERLIFIDVNTDPHTDKSVIPAWTEKAGKKLDEYEKKTLPQGQSAYVIVTNMSFHRALQSEQPGQAIMATGLGNDFWKAGVCRLSDVYRRKQKHIDVHNIIAAFQKYPQIPPTFDGGLPSEMKGKQSERVIIGETYFFEGIGENGMVGTVSSATVLENEKRVYLVIVALDGTNHIITQPISDDALADYKAHPEPFFGAIQSVNKNAKDAYELFEFFLDTYQKSTKEKLLEFMRGAPDIETLRQMEQPDLAIEYAERCAAMAASNLPKPTAA